MNITLRDEKIELQPFCTANGGTDGDTVIIAPSVKEVSFKDDASYLCLPFRYDIEAPITLRDQIEQILRSMPMYWMDADGDKQPVYFDSELDDSRFDHRISYFSAQGKLVLSYTQREFYRSNEHYPEGYVQGKSNSNYCLISLNDNTNRVRFVDSLPTRRRWGLLGCTKEYAIPNDQIVLRLVPAGQYEIGEGIGNGDFPEYFDDPARTVILTHDYYIGMRPITPSQWMTVMNSRTEIGARGFSHDAIRGAALGRTWPWTNAVDKGCFLARLRNLTGIENLDLPTEAHWGIARSTLNFRDFDEDWSIAEWCLDRSSDPERTDQQTDPTGPVLGDYRRVRIHCAGYPCDDIFDGRDDLCPSSTELYERIPCGFRVAFAVESKTADGE